MAAAFVPAQLVLVAVVSFLASTLGGIAGYGTGLLLPPVLVPIIGAEAVVPVIGVSALLTNASRAFAFRHDLDRHRVLLIAALALPTCLLGTYAYTLLAGPHVAALIGAVLIVLVPARYLLRRRKALLGPRGLTAASLGYGLLVGGTTGSGIVLLSILMAAGLQGAAVIATDAGISVLVGLGKTLVFQTAGSLPLASWAMALLIGAAATPGAFVARAMTRRISLRIHTWILDAVVILGGGYLVIQGIRSW